MSRIIPSECKNSQLRSITEQFRSKTDLLSLIQYLESDIPTGINYSV